MEMFLKKNFITKFCSNSSKACLQDFFLSSAEITIFHNFCIHQHGERNMHIHSHQKIKLWTKHTEKKIKYVRFLFTNYQDNVPSYIVLLMRGGGIIISDGVSSTLSSVPVPVAPFLGQCIVVSACGGGVFLPSQVQGNSDFSPSPDATLSWISDICFFLAS